MRRAPGLLGPRSLILAPDPAGHPEFPAVGGRVSNWDRAPGRVLKYREAMTERKHKDQKWSAEVTKNSDALDLEADIFESDDPANIARSLKRSAERSNRRKSAPFRSAMSMLTFYINRAGKNLSPDWKKTLEAAKAELRRAFGRKEVTRDVRVRGDSMVGNKIMGQGALISKR
jgi:Protein of unknown function (DUF3175)